MHKSHQLVMLSLILLYNRDELRIRLKVPDGGSRTGVILGTPPEDVGGGGGGGCVYV